LSAQLGGLTCSLNSGHVPRAQRERTPVTVFLSNVVKLRGIVAGFDAFCVLLDCDGHQQIVYKHATTTSPACRGPAGQIWTGGKHPSGEASSDCRTPKPAARRAVTPAHARAFAINFNARPRGDRFAYCVSPASSR